MKPKTIFLLVLAVLIVIVLFQNTRVVTFRFFFWKAEVSQLLLVLITLAIGFAGGFVTAKLSRGGDKSRQTV